MESRKEGEKKIKRAVRKIKSARRPVGQLPERGHRAAAQRNFFRPPEARSVRRPALSRGHEGCGAMRKLDGNDDRAPHCSQPPPLGSSVPQT